MKATTLIPASALLLASAALAGCREAPAWPADAQAQPAHEAAAGVAAALATGAGATAAAGETFSVAGRALHYFSQAVIHSEEPQANGVVVRSSEYIRLTGDLDGYVLYHPTSVIDHAANTLVNTGTQIFSGTVAGSPPVLLHDSSFRFDIDLATGATRGTVHFDRSAASNPGRWFECRLDVVGTGQSPEGDSLSDYTGECTARGEGGR